MFAPTYKVSYCEETYSIYKKEINKICSAECRPELKGLNTRI